MRKLPVPGGGYATVLYPHDERPVSAERPPLMECDEPISRKQRHARDERFWAALGRQLASHTQREVVRDERGRLRTVVACPLAGIPRCYLFPDEVRRARKAARKAAYAHG